MKTSQIVKSLPIALALLSVPNVFAANKGSLHVSSMEDVAGQTLRAGDYVVRWESNGPNVELRIMQGNRVVATAAAGLVPLPYASTNNSVLLRVNGNRQSLSLIYLSGKTFALEIRGPSATMNVSSNK